jgi:hypothetical protein
MRQETHAEHVITRWISRRIERQLLLLFLIGRKRGTQKGHVMMAPRGLSVGHTCSTAAAVLYGSVLCHGLLKLLPANHQQQEQVQAIPHLFRRHGPRSVHLFLGRPMFLMPIGMYI